MYTGCNSKVPSPLVQREKTKKHKAAQKESQWQLGRTCFSVRFFFFLCVCGGTGVMNYEGTRTASCKSEQEEHNRLKNAEEDATGVDERTVVLVGEGRTVAAFLFGCCGVMCAPSYSFFFPCSFILVEAGRYPSFNNEELVLANGSGRTLCNAENFTILSCSSPHPWVANSRSKAASPASGVPVHRALDPGGPGRGRPAWPPRRSFPPHAA